MAANPFNPWTRQFLHVVITTVVSVVAMASLLLLTAAGHSLGLLALIFATGTIGAVANNYKRFLQIPSSTMDVPELLRSRLVTVQLYLSPLIGGTFAVVLYASFMSGIISGALFPKFPNLAAGYTDVTSFLENTSPETNMDAAKALLWAFVAGFSERFVPNILDKLIRDSEESLRAKRE